MLKIDRLLRDRNWGFVLFTVYDAIMYEIRTEHLMDALALIKETMEGSGPAGEVPWPIDITAGPSWGDAEEVEL